MSDFSEQSSGDKMINVLHTSELDKCADCENRPDDEDRKPGPSNDIGEVDPEWIHWAEAEPRHPEDAHRYENKSKDGLGFRIHFV